MDYLPLATNEVRWTDTMPDYLIFDQNDEWQLTEPILYMFAHGVQLKEWIRPARPMFSINHFMEDEDEVSVEVNEDERERLRGDID